MNYPLILIRLKILLFIKLKMRDKIPLKWRNQKILSLQLRNMEIENLKEFCCMNTCRGNDHLDILKNMKVKNIGVKCRASSLPNRD